jgi:hypothetical protein
MTETSWNIDGLINWHGEWMALQQYQYQCWCTAGYQYLIYLQSVQFLKMMCTSVPDTHLSMSDKDWPDEDLWYEILYSIWFR